MLILVLIAMTFYDNSNNGSKLNDCYQISNEARRYSDITEYNSASIRRTVSCGQLEQNHLNNNSRVSFKEGLRRTVRGIKSMISTEDVVSTRTVPVQNKVIKKYAYPKLSSTSDTWLDEADKSTPIQIGSRKVSWANDISDIRNNVRKVRGIKKEFLSDSQLNKILENQPAEQINFERNTYQDNLVFDDSITNYEFISSENLFDIQQNDDIKKNPLTEENCGTMITNTHKQKYIYYLESSNNKNPEKDKNEINNNTYEKPTYEKQTFEKQPTYEKLTYEKQPTHEKKSTYALDDSFIEDKHAAEIIPKNILYRCASTGPQRKMNSKRRCCEKGQYYGIDAIKALVETEIHNKLDDKTFDANLVTNWCKDISNTVRDKLKHITRNKKKIITTTYIGSKVNQSGVHVSVRCEKNTNTDEFITVALEGEDFFVWVTLLLADY